MFDDAKIGRAIQIASNSHLTMAIRDIYRIEFFSYRVSCIIVLFLDFLGALLTLLVGTSLQNIALSVAFSNRC